MANFSRLRYEADPHNRLISEREEGQAGVIGFRQVLDGRFEIGDNNSLIYHVKKSQGIETPQQVKLTGNFSLDKNHNLVFVLDKWNNQIEGNRLIIKGDIIDVKSNDLSFSVVTKDSAQLEQVYILRLSGSWQADKYNRLTFNVEREKGNTDCLTFEGIWQVNKQNQVVYSYQLRELKRKDKIIRVISFKGYWDIFDKYRISYVLNEKLGSQFDFKISAGNYFSRMLVYEVGIGSAPKNRTITLFGKWQLNRRLGLLFEMEYERARTKSISFGADIKLGEGYDLSLRLKDSSNKDLGAELKLSREILSGQGEAFIKALASQKEIALVAGAGFRW